MSTTPTADTADAYIRTHDLTRDDLIRDNASLRLRLSAALEERDAAQRAHRRRYWLGAVWLLLTNGRDR